MRLFITLILISFLPVFAQAENLVPNPSFEIVTNEAPVSWLWQQGSASGKYLIDDTVAFAGKHSLKITNQTPYGPNTFSGFITHVTVYPETTYTLSCHVRGTDPGVAWVGGGPGWLTRISLPQGNDTDWQRVSATFTTEKGQRSFELRINTDSPTSGFWIDAMQIVEGTMPEEYNPNDEPGLFRLQVKSGDAISIGQNLLPNASFEQVVDDQPISWKLSQNNTDATFTFVPDARSGKQSILVTNSTPTHPHVYGQILLTEALSLIPGETYTLSLYVKSDDPGVSWCGGGDGWWIRLMLPQTNGIWRRVSKNFIARDGDVKCPLMINTDGPTKGFMIDDIKLELGSRPTPFLDTLQSENQVEVSVDIPAQVSVLAGSTVFRSYIWCPENSKPVNAQVKLAHADGSLVNEGTTETLQPGLNEVVITWAPLLEESGRFMFTLSCEGKTAQANFDLYSSAQFEREANLTANASAALKQVIDQAEAKNIPANYAKAAYVMVPRFLRVAAARCSVNRIPLAIDNAIYLRKLCDQQRENLENVIAGKAPAFTIPNPPLRDIVIRDGNFYVGAEPVMLVGGMGYNELYDELETYKDYGFNVLGDDFNAYASLGAMVDDDVLNPDVAPRLCDSWAKLDQMNLAVGYTPSLHYFPFWALQKYPDITGGDVVETVSDWSGMNATAGMKTKTYGAFFPFSITSPNLRRLVSDYYQHLFTPTTDVPGFRVVWMMNEPTYRSTDADYVALFREYLEKKFASIDDLNQAWGSQFANFEDVIPPTDSDDPARFDWLTFHQDQVASFYEWLAAEARKANPNIKLSNKPMAWTVFRPDEGIDFEREAELWEVPGCDAGRSPNGSTWAYNWSEAAILFDFQRSIAPEKPLGDHEYHYVHWPNMTAEYSRATYFHSYLHGLRMSQFWVWATGELGDAAASAGMEHTAWSQPPVAWGTATAALDLRRLAPYVAVFPGKPEAFIYVSRPSLYLNNDTHRDAIYRTYEAINFLDAPIGFMTDRMIEKGRLADCKVLVVPNASHVKSEALEAIADFTAKGGEVVLLGECFKFNEYFKPQTIELTDDNVIVMPLKENTEIATAIEPVFSQAAIQRPIRAEKLTEKPSFGVELRTQIINGKRVVYIIGLNPHPVNIHLQSQEPITSWLNVITGETGTSLEFTINPCDVYMLELN